MPKFVHVEIPTGDLRRAKAWYGKVFGWTFQDYDKDYTLIMDGSDNIGGIYRAARPIPKPDAKRPIVRAYVSVDEVAQKVKDIRRARGTILRDKSEVPGFGWWAEFADPQGVMLYLWEPARGRGGMQERMEQAAPPAPAMNVAMGTERQVSREARMLKT